MPVLRRRSVRLRVHEYRDGVTFVTVCTAGRQPLFGRVADGRMVRSWRGEAARAEWPRTADVRPDVVLDAFVVMPDHVRLLFGILPAEDPASDRDPTSGRGLAPDRRDTPPVYRYSDGTSRDDDTRRRFGYAVAGAVPSIMRQLKSIVTKRIRQREPGLRVWRGRYYDRVVRTDREADAVRRDGHRI